MIDNLFSIGFHRLRQHFLCNDVEIKEQKWKYNPFQKATKPTPVLNFDVGLLLLENCCLLLMLALVAVIYT